MNRVAAICIAALAAACSGSSSGGDDGSLAGNGALIGGHAADASDLPGVLYLKSGCTATKVAPKLLLTAAHCVMNPATSDPKWVAGDTVGWARDPAKGYVDAKVAAVHVHPDWMKACESAYCALSSTTVRLDAPDVAVLELADDVDVAAATVSAAALAPGDAVVLVGYGCTKGVLVPDDRAGVTLARADARTIPADATVHDGSAVQASDVAQVAGIYSITAGPSLEDGGAGLCPGDSGGPLYAKDASGALVVVGVNSNYTFRPDTDDQTGLPVTDWHTRLDPDARHDVAGWLASLGVKASADALPR